jgi:aminodeoxyfutalosine synthase
MSAPSADLAALAASHDILSLGMLADDVRRAKHGARTTFVRVADVPVDAAAPIVVPAAAGELRITGTPASVTAAAERVSAVAAQAGGVPVSGFSLADLEALAARESITLRALLEQLKAAGLELIADAPLDRLKDPRRAIEEVNIAGLALARATLESTPSGDVIDHLRWVEELQREVGVVRAFAPLARRLNAAAPTTGYDDVKRVALARVIVENVPTIQVDWQLYGPKLAQVALTMGADDLDAVSTGEGADDGRRRSTIEEVRRNIAAAGQEPVERNGRFEPIAAPVRRSAGEAG